MKSLKSFSPFLILIPLTLSACSLFAAGNVEINSTSVNNSYNNTKANQNSSDLAQIDDKLYYHYTNRFGASEYYEIGNSYSKKINVDRNISFDNIYKGKLLDINSDLIKEYNSEQNEWTARDDIKLPDNVSNYRISACGDTLYLETYEELYRCSGNEFQKWVTSKDLGVQIDLSKMYIDGDIIYYHKEKDSSDSFCRFDTKSKQSEEVDVGNISLVTGFIEHDDRVYYLNESETLHQVDFNTKKVKKLFGSGSGAMLFDLCGDTLCVAVQFSDTGIYISKNNGDFEKISDADADSLYIVDEIYIYYTAEEGKLFRVSVDGKKEEQVH